MSKFAAMVFRDEKSAYEGLHALEKLHAEGTLSVYGTNIIRRGTDGRISVLTRNGQGALGNGVGALVDGLIGLLSGLPTGTPGLAVLAGAGAVHDFGHIGVSWDFVIEVELELAPGKVAVIAEISEERVAPLDARMGELGVKVVRGTRQFEEDHLESRANAQARLFELRAERAWRKEFRDRDRAGTPAEEAMQKALTGQIEQTQQRLASIAERLDRELDDAKQELDAKLEALRSQASGVEPQMRKRIDRRVACLCDEFREREQKLGRARELTRKAIQYS